VAPAGPTLVVRAAIYCRISRDWEGEGRGVDRQLTDCLEIASRRGWTVVGHYLDNDVGASRYSKKSSRQEYRRLLGDIQAGNIDAVVIWMEDRLQRQVIELAEFLKVCDTAGVTRIASAGGEFDLSDADQRTTLYIKAAIAEAEIEKMSKRMRRRNKEAAEHGERAPGGKRPFGEAWRGKQQVSEEQAAGERELIHEAARRIIGGDSLRGIVTDWQCRGITTQFGKPWHNVNLRRMLLSPRLVGMPQHNGALYPGDWESILDREQWEVLCAILQDPARYKYERGGLPKHLLSGMAFCGLCGTRLTVRIRYGNRRYYCPTTPPLGGCGRIQRVAEPLEHLITEAVFEAVESDLFKRLIAGEEADPTQMLYEQLARDRGLLDRLEGKVAEELIKPSTARRNRAQVERRMENTRRWIARKRGGQIVGLAPRNLREVWPSLSLDRRRNIVKAVLMKVTVHPQPNSVVFDPGAIVVEWRI
jgi:site-specific DNA recombinase